MFDEILEKIQQVAEATESKKLIFANQELSQIVRGAGSSNV